MKNKKSYIIAEMAWSYTGSYSTAIELLQAAKDSGADAIGIHITNMETYMTKDYKCIAGQTLSAREDENESENDSVYDYLKKINLSNDQWIKFNQEANKLNFDIVAMCNDLESFLFSKKLNIKKYVIAASLFHENELLKNIIEFNNDIIIRIGGASLKEIDEIINFIFSVDKNSKINLLAGIQLYPTPINQLHIRSIQTLIDRYKDKKITLGIADHIDGDHPYAKFLPSIALGYGIETIEKHITTERELKLEDFEAALGIKEFKIFVDYIRTAEIALGDGNLDYLINPENKKYRLVLRKRVVANQNIKKGVSITNDMVTYMRCDSGSELEFVEKITGKIANKNINQYSGIDIKDVE